MSCSLLKCSKNDDSIYTVCVFDCEVGQKKEEISHMVGEFLNATQKRIQL